LPFWNDVVFDFSCLAAGLRKTLMEINSEKGKLKTRLKLGSDASGSFDLQQINQVHRYGIFALQFGQVPNMCVSVFYHVLLIYNAY
jgi:hypothetical protein